MENPTLKEIFKERLPLKIPGFYALLSSEPNVLDIRPIVHGVKGLLTFHVSDDYFTVMFHARFGNAPLISKQFYPHSSINEVMGWIKQIFTEIETVIASTKTPN